jgi:hypothetical protein
MLQVHPTGSVPVETARIAHQVFPKGNRYLKLRDELGSIYSDRDFETLFPSHGQPAQCPWRLALVCVMQFSEDLSDRQAAEAVRSDTDQTQPIHEALASKALLPKEHVVDAGYVDGTLLVESLQDFGLELIGPVRPDVSWQAKAPDGYDLSQFQIDWDKQQVTCPEGKHSQSWTPSKDA